MNQTNTYNNSEENLLPVENGVGIDQLQQETSAQVVRTFYSRYGVVGDIKKILFGPSTNLDDLVYELQKTRDAVTKLSANDDVYNLSKSA